LEGYLEGGEGGHAAALVDADGDMNTLCKSQQCKGEDQRVRGHCKDFDLEFFKLLLILSKETCLTEGFAK
jgi:hypothetical protein